MVGNGPSVYVTVVDAATGVAPTSTPTVLVSNGTTEDTAKRVFEAPPQQGPPKFISRSSEAGQFRITVSASGYQTLVRDGIRVRADGSCGQNVPAEIAARIAPLAVP